MIRFVKLPRLDDTYVALRGTTRLGTVTKTYKGWVAKGGGLTLGPYPTKRDAGRKLEIFGGK